MSDTRPFITIRGPDMKTPMYQLMCENCKRMWLGWVPKATAINCPNKECEIREFTDKILAYYIEEKRSGKLR